MLVWDVFVRDVPQDPVDVPATLGPAKDVGENDGLFVLVGLARDELAPGPLAKNVLTGPVKR